MVRTSRNDRGTKKITEFAFSNFLSYPVLAFRPRGRPKMKWENDVKQDTSIKGKKIYRSKRQAKSRNEWKRIIEQAKTHKEL
jgi:hypothetical protein